MAKLSDYVVRNKRFQGKLQKTSQQETQSHGQLVNYSKNTKKKNETLNFHSEVAIH